MFVDERDMDIANTIHEYFVAVRDRWPMAWNADGLGYMLNRTNGYRALCRLLRPAYLHFSMGNDVINRSQFGDILKRSKMSDTDFVTDNFPPGTTGESLLFNRLVVECDLAPNEGHADID
jgi:hypothetical protein